MSVLLFAAGTSHSAATRCRWCSWRCAAWRTCRGCALATFILLLLLLRRCRRCQRRRRLQLLLLLCCCCCSGGCYCCCCVCCFMLLPLLPPFVPPPSCVLRVTAVCPHHTPPPSLHPAATQAQAAADRPGGPAVVCAVWHCQHRDRPVLRNREEHKREGGAADCPCMSPGRCLQPRERRLACALLRLLRRTPPTPGLPC